LLEVSVLPLVASEHAEDWQGGPLRRVDRERSVDAERRGPGLSQVLACSRHRFARSAVEERRIIDTKCVDSWGSF
jgi:hypothetical protein